MKTLAAIASYGQKNLNYLERLIREYSSMRMGGARPDIVVLSEGPKDLGPGVEVRIGLPTKNPWSLPFAHLTLFKERADEYDLFIYSEDDTLITEANIDAFLRASEILPEDRIAGFLRYELDGQGNKYYSTIHSHFHWLPQAEEHNGELYGYFTNLHSACYILTKRQLKKAIGSGGYIDEPYEGPYDLLCTAATAPYRDCGFKKVIPLSSVSGFEVRHLPGIYIGRMGIAAQDLDTQINALREIASGKRGAEELLPRKVYGNPWLNKKYYERRRVDIIEHLPEGRGRVLSVGCGTGDTERAIMDSGHELTAVPLDNVIASVAAGKGINTVSPDIYRAYGELSNKKFECVVFSDVMHCLDRFDSVLNLYANLLDKNGVMLVSLPNVNLFRLFQKALRKKADMETYRVYLKVEAIKKFLRQRFRGAKFHYKKNERYGFLSKILSDSVIASVRK